MSSGNGKLHTVESQLKALFVRGLEGNASDYQLFLAELAGHLRGYLRRRIPNFRDDIEDLVQEILLAVHNARHIFRPNEPLTAWVHAIACYKLIDFLRIRTRREWPVEPLGDQDALFAESDKERTEARRDLGKLLAHLPVRQRLSILHVKVEGLSVAEAARITGLTESAVKNGIRRGLKALGMLVRRFDESG
ncbi:sigma-70 family RNA polymerase sigma factor (plasmid) [Paraburkholderia sp. PREW-6R]|uniref:sigma-70 family RNA polymerase sigma factor n=1 Tax=Paraburkholderia sp. PREW-6R TaxID=3141544 RepID=UPI0031F47BBF